MALCGHFGGVMKIQLKRGYCCLNIIGIIVTTTTTLITITITISTIITIIITLIPSNTL